MLFPYRLSSSLSRLLWAVWLPILALTACSSESPISDGLDYSLIPTHYRPHLYNRYQQLLKVSEGRGADFLFVTDTHIADNDLDSPAMLRFMLDNGLADKVIWGGDAITAYGDITAQWVHHQQRFADVLRPLGGYYMVRGNHEFTAMSPNLSGGQTLGPLHTARLLRRDTSPDVVRPLDNPEACYYYFDDPQRSLRFCVFDTTDSISSTTQPWATVEHISRHQLEWMDANALHGVPEGYSLVVVTHIGIIGPTYRISQPFEPLLQLLHRAEAPILMVVSGHMHQDFQTYDDAGLLHVLTGSDATYREYACSPFLHDCQRRRGTTSAQLFDCFTISSDHRMIDAVRIGAGYDRTFHLDTLQVTLDSSRRLTTSRLLPSSVASWTCYDATGYTCPNDAWQPPSTVLKVASDGVLQPLLPGQAVVMATDRQGHKEFFPVTVVP